MANHLDLIMFVALIGCILLGFPVSFSISGVAILFAILGAALGVMDFSLMGALGQRVFAVMTNEILVAIPLFVFMGVMLQKSEIAEQLLETMGRLFGGLRGGLGISVILVGALLAASTGIVGATVIAMGMIALPTMLRNGYDSSLASGIVCTSGTLGQIIPPSTLLIILSDVMSNSYQQAQFELGKFSVETISVGQIFAAALLPGIMLVLIYICYVLLRAWVSPDSAPALEKLENKASWIEVAGVVLPPVLLILAVLGSILGGIATPTEAASVGAVGALLLAGWHTGPTMRRRVIAATAALFLLALAAGNFPVRLQRSSVAWGEWIQALIYAGLVIVALYGIFASLRGTFRKNVLLPTMTSTMTVTAMIFATILTASIFSLVFIGLGGDETVKEILSNMPGGALGALLFCMALIFILGFFLDFVEITVIVLPVTVPALILMGHDPIWLTVLIAINLQTSFLTPPFGFSLFYLRGAAPPEVTTGHIYLGVMPFILLQIIGVVLIWFIPSISTWLPSVIF